MPRCLYLKKSSFRVRSSNCIGLLAIAALCPAVYGAWQPTGPYGGEAEFVAVTPAQRDFLVAGTRGGILYESRNGGASWTNVSFPRQLSGEMHVLQLHPKQAGTWYVGMEDSVASLSGLYRTTDGGETWARLPGLQGKAVWSLALFPANPDIMAAGTADGVYLSEDAGENWKRISPEEDIGLQPVVSLAFHPYERNTLYAGTTHLPWRTTDGGATWTSIHDGMLDDSDVFSITPDPRSPDVVLASACSGVYRTFNGGKLWARLPTPPGAFRVYLVTRDPQQSDVVFAATTSGLVRSSDRGMTWTKVSPEVVKSIAFDPNDAKRVYAAAVSSGILISTDSGRTFSDANIGFSDHNLTALAGAGKVLYASSIYEGVRGGIFRSEDLGHSWDLIAGRTALAGENPRLLAASPEKPNLLYAAAFRGMLKSTDGGRIWTHIRAPGDGTVRALAVLPGTGAAVLAGTASGLFRSNDGGTSWRAVALGPPDQPVQWIQSSGTEVVAAGNNLAAYLSADGGRTWQTCASPLAEAEWYGLTGSPLPGGVALAATSHGLFRSTDGCRSWASASTGFRGTVPLVITHPTRPDEFIVVQDGHVLISANKGIDWQPAVEEGHPATYAAAVVVLPSNPEMLFVLLPRRGVFRTVPMGSDLAAR